MATSPITSPDAVLDQALANIPKDHRHRVITAYLQLRTRFAQAVYNDDAYDAIGISAGKICEAVLRILEHALTGHSTAYGTHIGNFADACRKLEQHPKTAGIESLRVIIPRALLFIYTIRNKRGIGHSGGDVEANRTDITTIVTACTWVICELIRIYRKLSLEDAQGLVDTLTTRRIPQVWEIMGKKRVLRTDLNFKDKVLLLCYACPREGILVEDLFEWVEYSGMSMFKRTVLTPLHDAKMIEYDTENDAVIISPLGEKYAEDNLVNT